MKQKVKNLFFGTAVVAVFFFPGLPLILRGENGAALAGTGEADLPSQKVHGTEPRQSELELSPSTIPIGLFFERGNIKIRGTLPKDSAAVLVVRGRDEEESMSIRGKRLGLWMAVGTASFKHVPSLYQYYTSKPLAGIAASEVAAENGVGFDKIEDEMVLETGTGKTGHDDRFWKDEFVKFKRGHGLYTMAEGVLEVVAGQDGRERVEGEIVIPSQAREGDYRVVLMGFKDGALVSRVEEALAVTFTRPVDFLGELAKQHGWLYGIIAVVVALGAGLGVGVIVPSKGSH